MSVAAGLLLVASVALAATEAQDTRDLRTVELLDVDCASELGRSRLTLFGNGTVRLRTWREEDDDMRLRELAPDALNGFVNRLREIDLSEAEERSESPAGDWIERCTLALEVDGEISRFGYAGYDSVSLALSRVVSIADEIRLLVEVESIAADFPPRYEPRPGDVLRRRDGVLFEVIAFTSDQKGIELWGVDQPLVVYILREELIGEFIALVEEP